MIKTYRKKPVKIKAMQYLRDENIHRVLDWVGNDNMYYDEELNEYRIKTLEGDHIVRKYDYIIQGVHGEFYPCKPDIFAKTYDEEERA